MRTPARVSRSSSSTRRSWSTTCSARPGPPPRSAISTPDANVHLITAPLPWSITLVDDVARGQRQHHGAGRQQPNRMPHHRGRNRSRGENSRWRQRPDVLPGEVRMTAYRPTAADHRYTKRPRRCRTAIRILAVPIVLFWIAVTVLVNVIAPQLEVVGEDTFGADGTRGRAVDDGDEADGRQLQGIRFQQHGDDRHRGSEAARRPTRTATTTKSSASCSRTPSTSSTSRTSGAIG